VLRGQGNRSVLICVGYLYDVLAIVELFALQELGVIEVREESLATFLIAEHEGGQMPNIVGARGPLKFLNQVPDSTLSSDTLGYGPGDPFEGALRAR
jgi:hypothetical protein